MVNNSEITIKVNLSADDYERFNRFFNRTKYIISLVLYPVLFLAILLYMSLDDFSSLFFILSIGIPISLLITGIMMFIFVLLIKIKSKRIFKTNSLINREHIYKVNNEGVSTISDYGSGSIKWIDFYKISEDKNAFYLFISKNQASILPKRQFASNEDIVSFKEYILSNINKKKIKFQK